MHKLKKNQNRLWPIKVTFQHIPYVFVMSNFFCSLSTPINNRSISIMLQE